MTSSSVGTDARTIVERFNGAMKEFWQTGNTGQLEEVLSPRFVQHWPGFPSDRDGYLQRLHEFRKAFPDLQKTTEDMLVDGHKVVDRVSVRATHTGDLLGFPATNRHVELTEIHIARVEGGQIVERWGEWDLHGLLRQLGVFAHDLAL